MTQKCDFCEFPALVDGKTILGPWAFMCPKCFEDLGVHVTGLYKYLKKEFPDPEH